MALLDPRDPSDWMAILAAARHLLTDPDTPAPTEEAVLASARTMGQLIEQGEMTMAFHQGLEEGTGDLGQWLVIEINGEGTSYVHADDLDLPAGAFFLDDD